jgi:hypothetical protein
MKALENMIHQTNNQLSAFHRQFTDLAEKSERSDEVSQPSRNHSPILFPEESVVAEPSVITVKPSISHRSSLIVVEPVEILPVKEVMTFVVESKPSVISPPSKPQIPASNAPVVKKIIPKTTSPAVALTPAQKWSSYLKMLLLYKSIYNIIFTHRISNHICALGQDLPRHIREQVQESASDK